MKTATCPTAPWSFASTLKSNSVSLVRAKPEILQLNIGLACNQTCAHCHLEAGPDRTELMDSTTMAQAVEYARRSGVKIIDITGGAPELNPNLLFLLDQAAGHVPTVILRSNLSVWSTVDVSAILECCVKEQVVITASFPSTAAAEFDRVRGEGAFKTAIEAIKRLNSLGYGVPDSGLILNLVSNPTAPELPPNQIQMEQAFREALKAEHGVEFNDLLVFANSPLGRFRKRLVAAGVYDCYMDTLAKAFNPGALMNLMCRSLVSVAWDGSVYDCDFNLAAGLPAGGGKKHISKVEDDVHIGDPIAIAPHCFACAAGCGFT